MSDNIIPASASQEIKTEKVNINKLFTDFWFRVPEYQRSYKWGPEEIDDLLDDIQHGQRTAKDKEYFLGSVVLQKYLRASGNLTYTCYDVLDGQQRLTTLLITMAVLRDLATGSQLKNRAAKAIFQEENQFENQPKRIRIEFLIRDEVDDFVEKFLEKAAAAPEVIANDSVFAYHREQVRQAINGPIYGKSFGKYLMLRVEYHLMDRSQPFAAFNRISVEHVLPQRHKAGSTWLTAFTPEQKNLWTDRLANLVLLSRIKNSELSNREFADKKQKYFKSSVNVFPNVVRVMQYADWKPEVLEERQTQLVDMLMENFK